MKQLPHPVLYLFVGLVTGALAAAPASAQVAEPDSEPEQQQPEQQPPPEAVQAPPEAKPPRDRWKMAAEFSYTDQSGNKVLRLLTGGLSVAHREKEAFELEGTLQSRYGTSEGEVVARNHFGSLSLDLHPSDLWSPYLSLTAERDLFKRLDLRFSGGAGAKLTPYQSERNGNEGSISLAMLYSYENLTATDEYPLGPERSIARWSLRVRGKQELRPGVSLQHSTDYQPVWDYMADYLLRSETGTKVLLTERLALSVTYQINRTARPPEGVEPEDRLFKTGLIIDF